MTPYAIVAILGAAAVVFGWRRAVPPSTATCRIIANGQGGYSLLIDGVQLGNYAHEWQAERIACMNGYEIEQTN